MTNRERFQRIMRYEPVDRLPVMQIEPYEKPSVERWRKEGLPEDQEPVDFLGMSRLVHVGGVGLSPVPAFEQKVISEDDQYIIETTAMGGTVRRDKRAPSTFYGHIDHPIKTRQDWERYKERLDPETWLAHTDHLTPERIREINESTEPVGACFFPFFFRLGFYTMGMERFLTAFYEEPDMMHDMFSHAGNLVLQALRRVLENVQLDLAHLNEDLAGKNGPLISPRIYEEFWYPYQDPIVQLLQEHNVPVISMWSAGEFDVLLPGMMEHGINCTWPLEAVCGMDALDLRKRYGKELLLAGNIPKEALIAGPDAIDRELDRLMPLIQEGGFIPALDDMTPMECPFSHFEHMIRKLQDIRLD